MDSTRAFLRPGTAAARSAEALAGELSALRATALAGLAPAPGEGILAGPSHAARWRHLARQGAVPPPCECTHFVGGAGLPVWNHGLFAEVAQRHRPGIPVLLILPDPRFGNAILEAPQQLFADGFSHIARHLISPAGDREMIRRHMAALGQWRAAFGADLRLLPWTGLMTAHVHLETGRYWQDGAYRYPAMERWLGGEAARLGAEDLSPLLSRDSAAGFDGLYADRSLHPTLAGYVLLMRAAAGAPMAEALAEGQAARDRWLRRLLKRAGTLLEGIGPVRIAGGRVWQRAARLALGQAGRATLAEAGLALGGPPVPGAVHVRIAAAGDPPAEKTPGTGALRQPLVIPWYGMAALARGEVGALAALSSGELLRGAGFGWADLLAEAGPPAAWIDAAGEDCPSHIGIAAVILGLLEGLAICRRAGLRAGPASASRSAPGCAPAPARSR
ncbi:hypothetical protein [Poseidonocella sp. HB161398]|uniref:hypothetical protein n=1 Tax=Poseidonocella sp. HB161398 TaxID=2320855 RepID=UPI001109BE15|nr:hypothetical protein [Poseidonocella sp. HB161398]